jgi:hypothetical protein
MASPVTRSTASVGPQLRPIPRQPTDRVDAAVGIHQSCSSIQEPGKQIRSGTPAMLGGDAVREVVAARSQQLGVSAELIGIHQGLEGHLVEIGQMTHVVAHTPPGGGCGQRPLRGSELVEYPPQSNRLGDEVVDEDRQFGSHQRPVQRGGRLSRCGVRSVPIVVLIYPATSRSW